MNTTLQITPVRKTVIVDATPAKAFQVFTAGMDRWWPKGHGIGSAPVRESIIEPFVGGRWYTKCEDGSEAVVGHIRVWQPGGRTRVELEHRDFERMGAAPGESMRKAVDGGWSPLLELFAKSAAGGAAN